MTSRPRHASPPLLFVIFWLGFTSVHAFFMLRGFWGSAALFFLVPFYLLFFGVGIYMALAWRRGVGLKQRFGTPTLGALPPVTAGQPLQFSVDFDKAGPQDTRLEGQLRWVEVGSKGQSGRVLAEALVQGVAAPGARGTVWQGRGVVPAQPSATGRIRLELVLQPAGSESGSAWRFELPLHDPSAAPRIEAKDIQRLEPALRWIMIGLAAGGSWQLYGLMARDNHELFALFFPAAFFLAAWILHDLRETLLAAVGTGGAGQAEMGARLKPFLARTQSRVQLLFALAVLAFFVEAFGLFGSGHLLGK